MLEDFMRLARHNDIGLDTGAFALHSPHIRPAADRMRLAHTTVSWTPGASPSLDY